VGEFDAAPRPSSQGAQRRSLVVGLEGGGLARRYVFDVNTSERHLAQLRYKDRLGRERLCLGAEIALPADVASADIWIEARQSGLLYRRYIPPRSRPDSAPIRSGCWSVNRGPALMTKPLSLHLQTRTPSHCPCLEEEA
jgi:hypothetical protein